MTTHLSLPVTGGTMSYEVHGEGPVVVCIPGMGDLRSTFRFTVPGLVAAGYRVAVVDLRGHGDSATTFASYDNEANAADIIALIEHLGGPAVLIGNSMGAAISTIIAATHPDLVSGLVLIGPFVRNGKVGRVLSAVMALALTPALVATTWNAYLPSLYPGRRPDDFDAYRASVIASIRNGRRTAVSRTMHTDHSGAEALLGQVHTNVLVVMGELDPDFPSPSDEAAWIVSRIGGQTLLVPEAGHYPHSQRPDLVTPAITAFLSTAAHRA